MDSITIKARAKINLTLDVINKRPDGYHNLCMIMQTLRLHDTLQIKKTSKYPFKLVCDHDKLPVDERNLVFKAATFILKEYDIKQGIFIHLHKRIPVSAGLAGGSSDCAAALLGLNRLLALDIPPERLMKLARMFGADVPFCMMGGTALAEGIGDRLTRLPPHPPVWVLLVRLPVIVSTPSVFSRFDPAAVDQRPDLPAMLEALDNRNLSQIAGHFCNVLTTVTTLDHPEINEITQLMRQFGALNALMSGSGPTVFGYFEEKERALAAIQALRAHFPRTRDIFLTGIHNVYE